MSNLYITLISFGISVVVSHIDFLFPCRQRLPQRLYCGLTCCLAKCSFDILSIFASFDLILWAISLVFARCNIVPERFLMFCFLTLHVFYRSWSNCLANCCCRQAVVVACLVLLVSQKCVCFCLYCLLNMLVLNSICLAAWQLHICLRIYCLLCYRWRQLEMAGLLVFLTAVLDLNIFLHVNLCFMGFTFLLLRALFSLPVSICGCILSAATSGLSFFCLVAAVDFLIQLYDSITFLSRNSWTFWSCEHFIRSL